MQNRILHAQYSWYAAQSMFDMDEQYRATEKLLLMVKTGNFSDISTLLTQFPEVINGTDKNGNTALILAAYYGMR